MSKGLNVSDSEFIQKIIKALIKSGFADEDIKRFMELIDKDNELHLLEVQNMVRLVLKDGEYALLWSNPVRYQLITIEKASYIMKLAQAKQKYFDHKVNVLCQEDIAKWFLLTFQLLF